MKIIDLYTDLTCINISDSLHNCGCDFISLDKISEGLHANDILSSNVMRSLTVHVFNKIKNYTSYIVVLNICCLDVRNRCIFVVPAPILCH